MNRNRSPIKQIRKFKERK